jgi:hypothetical protein
MCDGVVTLVVLKIQVFWDVMLCHCERDLLFVPEDEGYMIL